MTGALVVKLPNGDTIPRFGLGTWRMGERKQSREAEIKALELGLALGAKLIDTAEMYGEGGAEEAVGKAMRGRRNSIFLVSKVYPHNASRAGAIAACERSLARLATDRIDLYLLHWRGSIPLEETLEAFERLRAAGKIRSWGVSNFDTADIQALVAKPGGAGVVTNQVLYNLARRGPEWDLLPWQRERGITTMAYSPLDQARMLGNRRLVALAKKHAATPARIALAWLLRFEDVVSIPKATHPDHVRDNLKALDLRLDADDVEELDAAFPPPRRKHPLEML